MRTIEALAAAIAALNDFHSPESEAFRCMNPGLLKAEGHMTLEPHNENGNRIFTSLLGGWRALIADLENKCQGKYARRNFWLRKLKPDAPLTLLLTSYGFAEEQSVKAILDYVHTATGNLNINPKTLLGKLLE